MSYFDDHEDRIIFGGYRSHRSAFRITCKRCGAEGLKWRLTDEGDWRLFEDERVEHNRLKEHHCVELENNDFEDLTK